MSKIVYMLFITIMHTCTSSCRAAGQEEVPTAFGPPQAEEEIRSAFNVVGALPNINDLIRLAEVKGASHEPMRYDRSLSYCDVGRNRSDLNLEAFYFGRSSDGRVGLNYVAAYDQNRQVVCIETRHAYPGL